MKRREITVDIRAFLIPGTYVWLRFVDHGWVPVIVTENRPDILITSSIHTEMPVNVQQWLLALRQGNIIICPN